MNPYFRYFAIIGVALVLGLAIYFTGQIKPDNSKMFMGVGGDPRMRLCDGPANGELAQPDILAKLGIAAPLVKADTDKAAYRVSVLRSLGQESLSVTFLTPQTGAGKVTVARWADGAFTSGQADLDVTDAATLIFAFKEAKIWDAVKPTIETLARAGGASAVIEVRAPGVTRCVTTRYDDERVRPLLAAFVNKIGPLVEPVSIDALQAPAASFIPTAAAATTSGGQGR
jgi:hypothetical protein